MSSRTTFHLSMPRWRLGLAHIRAALAQRDPLAIVALPTLLIIIGLLLARQLSSAAPVVMQTAPQPIIMIATARSLPTPARDRAAAALPTAAPRLITAYTSPNGEAFPDAIPEPAPAMWIGRWGDAWIAIQWTPNPVWIRASDVGARLADVRPVPAVELLPVAVPQVAPAPYQVANEPPPVPDTRPADQADSDLAAHQAQQAAWCAAGGAAAQPAYCALVQEWMAAH